jgi:hypothetical protein
MLTDPPVTPVKWYEQISFAFLVALIATLLDRFYGYRVQHLFMAVFSLSIFVNLLRADKEFIPLLKVTGIILFFVMATLTFIEIQAPYYFEMEG